MTNGRLTWSFAGAVLLSAGISLLAQSPGPAPKPAAPPQKHGRLFPPTDLGLLETPDRDQWSKPDVIMDALGIADGASVADLGAGGGWFTIQLARRVGPNGLVYAEDIQPQMIEALKGRVQHEGLTNVRTVMGTPTDPRLPAGLDVVLIVDAYHEMDDPAHPDVILTLLRNVERALKPQGRVGVVDFLPGGGGPGPVAEDRVNPDVVIAAAAASGLKLLSSEAVPPFQFLLVFGKATPSTLNRGGSPSSLSTSGSMTSPIRTALTIAGSDSSGGAGIQADLKTFAALGVYGTSAIAAITAQNTLGVVMTEAVASELVTAQIEAVAGDIDIHATKTGMLATTAVVEAVAAAIQELQLPNVVVDPVMLASSGERLLDEDGVRAMIAELLPRARVVTPNIPEAEVLGGQPIRSLEDVREAARRIHGLGPTTVVIKGGHATGNTIVDLLFDGHGFVEFPTLRIASRSTHGTGCTFASAIAACLALGYSVPDATGRAQAYVAGAIREGLAIGHGHGPLDHFWGGILKR